MHVLFNMIFINTCLLLCYHIMCFCAFSCYSPLWIFIEIFFSKTPLQFLVCFHTFGWFLNVLLKVRSWFL